MLRSTVLFSLRYRAVVIALACLALGYGIYVGRHVPLDVFPEFAPPLVVVQTEAPGLSAEQVEQLVTRPIENELNGAPHLESIRSQSIQGLSAITVVFRDDADLYRVRQMVAERLGEVAGELPDGVKPPKVGPLTSSTGLVLSIGLTSAERSPLELRTFAEWTLRQRLLGVPGVSRVDIFGGERRQLQIRVDPDRLLAHGITMDEVLDAAKRSTGVRGAGFIEGANQRIIVRTEGQALTPRQIGNATVAGNAALSDVATVVDGSEPRFGDALVMGERGVILLCWSQFGVNTLDVTRAIEDALAQMRPALDATHITLHPRLFRQASFIEAALYNIEDSLVIGGVLVAVVLFLFLLDLRSALASFVSIPLSLLLAVTVMRSFGVSLNTISLGGFAIAIGVVVDDAIIDVENILRRVREHRARAGPRKRFIDVVLDASLEVRNPVVYATFIVALVFLPVLTMSGVQGRLFAPLAQSFVLSTLASLLVALTLTPALCFVLFRKTAPHTEPGYLRRLKTRHAKIVERLAHHPRRVLRAAALAFVLAVLTLPFLGGEFLPQFREGHFVVHMVALPGTSIDESLRMGRQVTQALLKIPDIATVSQQVGRAEGGEDTWGTHLGEFHVDLRPGAASRSEHVEDEIRAALSGFPGLRFNVMPFMAERMEETISGATSQLVLNIFGEDLDLLDREAERVREALSSVPGAVDVTVDSEPGLPELTIRLRQDRLGQLGFVPLDVLDAIRTASQGSVVAETYEGNRTYDVAVVLDDASRRDPESMGQLLIRSRSGAVARLSDLADLSVQNGRYMIVRDGAQRRQQVSCNVAGRDVASFVAEAKATIGEKVPLYAGTYITWSGSAEEQRAANRELMLDSLSAGVGIVLLLVIVFQSGRNVALVLANMPFALIGGVIAVLIAGGRISIGTLVGFVTLFGITMRNSIMLISHYQHLVDEEGVPWNATTMVRGVSERLVPILMTALVTGLALLPLALGTGDAGREIEGPMAIVILGGLVTSTALNLIVLPTIALRYGRFARATDAD